MFPIMTRRAAVDAGLKRYYTGKPCSKGHDSQRFTSTGACIKCASGYSKDYVGRLRKESNARLAGLFVYPTHPDDFAALLAYAQGLDLQRGRVPKAPTSINSRAAAVVMNEAELDKQAIDAHNAYVAFSEALSHDARR